MPLEISKCAREGNNKVLLHQKSLPNKIAGSHV